MSWGAIDVVCLHLVNGENWTPRVHDPALWKSVDKHRRTNLKNLDLPAKVRALRPWICCFILLFSPIGSIIVRLAAGLPTHAVLATIPIMSIQSCCKRRRERASGRRACGECRHMRLTSRATRGYRPVLPPRRTYNWRYSRVRMVATSAHPANSKILVLLALVSDPVHTCTRVQNSFSSFWEGNKSKCGHLLTKGAGRKRWAMLTEPKCAHRNIAMA